MGTAISWTVLVAEVVRALAVVLVKQPAPLIQRPRVGNYSTFGRHLKLFLEHVIYPSGAKSRKHKHLMTSVSPGSSNLTGFLPLATAKGALLVERHVKICNISNSCSLERVYKGATSSSPCASEPRMSSIATAKVNQT